MSNHDFVRVGELVINLAAITTIQPQKWDGRECIRIEFIGGTVERIYRDRDKSGVYKAFMAWLQEVKQVEEEEEYYDDTPQPNNNLQGNPYR